jgi:hypothetical protein
MRSVRVMRSWKTRIVRHSKQREYSLVFAIFAFANIRELFHFNGKDFIGNCRWSKS